MEIKVLDKGYVRIKPTWIMGEGDIEIVNDARTSYNKEVTEISDKDLRLIRYLGKHKHTSCFRGTACKIEVYAPLMVARQWWKYIIGSHHDEDKLQDSLTNWNESSRRYITEQVEFYTPTDWRETPENSKQGSGKNLPENSGKEWTEKLIKHQLESERLYEEALHNDICPEQARLFLAAYGLYVRWRWTCSLQTVAHFINQRMENSAQKEIQEYAKAIYQITKPIWEVGLQELLEIEELQ
jgi:thymidylate synthase (FAD)